ncbi:HNH endonuclease signature motif containing protein [Planotetraspora kaengkrachanensis]|nr:DUF222 domain-containing protein [Planotetraspora kaengkrachanensis]
MAGVGMPGSAAGCLAEVEELVFARDRLMSAIAARVGRVHGAGEARAHGHASTRTWLRSGCGMSSGSASSLVGLAVELARLPVVRTRFAEGSLSEGQVAAICVATSGLSDEQARVAEPILVGLADRASPGEVSRAGRYLREVLDPGWSDKESEADHGRRFLRVRPTGSGGLEGEFRLPREAGARLRALLDAFARPKVEGDDRPLRVRNADAFIALLGQQISTELLVLVNAESLPDDHPAKNSPPGPQAADKGEQAGADDGAEPTADGSAEPTAETDPGPGRSTAAPEQEREPGAVPRDEPEPELGDGAAWWAGLGERVDRLVPGLLLATGQLLPVREIHRLARTSSLVRLVMDADGQVLDMGRAVRLATKAQRKAAFARYATCWVQGCPLPATMCQIDHADNWSDGGRTDLRLLGPACQFHNRDRYRRPHLYQRRRTGKDRWAFTYTGTHTSRNTARNTGQNTDRNAGGPVNRPTRT